MRQSVHTAVQRISPRPCAQGLAFLLPLPLNLPHSGRNGISTVIPESSFTLSWEGVISASRIFGGGFISLLDEISIFRNQTNDGIQFVGCKSGVPCNFDIRLDPHLAFKSFASDMHMASLCQIKTEEADAIRTIWNRNPWHVASLI